jgi:hypothetical protein
MIDSSSDSIAAYLAGQVRLGEMEGLVKLGQLLRSHRDMSPNLSDTMLSLRALYCR